jgi:transcriptional regulator with XRE-family HTH domain
METPPVSRGSLSRAFAKTVRDLRKRAGLAQEQLALQAGVARGYMGRLERGQHLPTLAVIYKLLPSLKVTFAQFAREFDRNLKKTHLP